jgi:hypothetical protein
MSIFKFSITTLNETDGTLNLPQKSNILLICKIVLLDFVHRLNFTLKNNTVSEVGFCFRLQVKEGGREEDKKPVCCCPLVALAKLCELFLYHFWLIAS